MTQEEKDKRKRVIFDELCRRAPYGTFCYVPSYNKPLLLIGAEKSKSLFLFRLDNGEIKESLFEPYCDNDTIKPYLRRTVFMSKEECAKVARMRRYTHFYSYDTTQSNEYIYSNHWDFGCSVESELALEAPEGMYETKSE